MCSSVAKLTQWADRVITDGCVDPTEDYVNQVIEPVRLAVNSLASNLLAISIVPKSTSFHNSLPDLGNLFLFLDARSACSNLQCDDKILNKTEKAINETFAGLKLMLQGFTIYYV